MCYEYQGIFNIIELTPPSPHPYGQPDYKITIFFGWQFSLLIFSKLDALLNIKPWQEGLGTATSSRRGANDTAEDIAILDVGTCTAEILGAIIAYIQLSISIERQNNLIIMTYLDLSHVRLGLHICCDSNSDWHQRLGLVSFHDMRRRPWFFLSGLGPQERHLLMGLTPSSEKRICTSNFRCIEQSQTQTDRRTTLHQKGIKVIMLAALWREKNDHLLHLELDGGLQVKGLDVEVVRVTREGNFSACKKLHQYRYYSI